MLIVYNKDSGKIISYFPNEFDPLFVYEHYSQDFKDNLAWFEDNEWTKEKYINHYIQDGQLIKYTEQEIYEKQKYGKILTEEERVEILLAPSLQEIQKAKNTVEILTTLQEVGLI